MLENEGVRIEFSQHGHFDSFTVYRQTTLPFDLGNLPPPIATNLKTMYCVDTDVAIDMTYHYMVATYRANEIEYSEIVSILVTFDPPYALQGAWNKDTQAVVLTWEFDW